MPNLKELKVSVGKIPGLNLGEHLSGNSGLQHLHLVLSSPGDGGGRPSTNLHRELQSPLPVSLSRVSVEASKLPVLHPAALKVSGPTSKHPVNPKSMSTAKSREGRRDKHCFAPTLSLCSHDDVVMSSNLCADLQCRDSLHQRVINCVSPLQHLSSASLHLSLVSDEVRLERDLFLNLGSVQNLSLDISGSVLMSPNNTVAEVANPSTKYKVGIPNSVFLKDLALGQKALPCSCHSVG